MDNPAGDIELRGFRIPQWDWEAAPGSAQAPVMASLDSNVELQRQVSQLSERLGKRQRSEQPGHPGQSQDLYPVESDAEVFNHIPSHCQGCGHDLTDWDLAPYRHQILGLPPIVLITTEHRLHQRKCTHCGAITYHPLTSAATRSN